MKSKIFLDTNVIIDFLETTRSRNNKAIHIVAALVKNDYDIFISEDMLTTIYYIVKKRKREVLIFFQEIMENDNWHIVPFGKNVIENAIAYTLEHGYDLEDSLQCFCAKEHKCDILLTNDKKFVDCGVKILDYDAFLKDHNG